MVHLLWLLCFIGIVILNPRGNRLFRIRIGHVFMILNKMVLYFRDGIVILLMFVIVLAIGLLFSVFVRIVIDLFVRLFGLVKNFNLFMMSLLLLIEMLILLNMLLIKLMNDRSLKMFLMLVRTIGLIWSLTRPVMTPRASRAAEDGVLALL